MKAAKMICLSGIIVLAMLVAALLLFVETKDAAFALKKDETSAIYYVDGSVADQEVTVERGQFITVSVEYNGEIYLPKLLTNEEKFAYSIDGNVFSINENSYIGGYLLLYAVITVGEEEIDIKPLTVVPVWESNFGEKIINESSYDYYKLSFSDENIISAKTNIKMLNGGVTGKVISDGEGIDDVINVAKHSYAGLSIEFEEVEVTTYDNLGNASVQTATNGADNLILAAYATLSLSGSGTSSNPYLVSSVADMNLVKDYDGTYKYFRQVATLTFDGTPSTLALVTFDGNYDGNNYSITYKNLSSVSSCFAKYNDGTIYNLYFKINTSCSFSGYYVGGLCQANHGTIQNVRLINYSSLFSSIIRASSTGTAFCGGIAGTNSGTITGCSVNISIISHRNTGGIVGMNNGTISYCTINRVSVLWNSFTNYSVGGVVGLNYSSSMINNNDIRTIIVMFNTYNSTALPNVGGMIGKNYENPLDFFTNSFSYFSFDCHFVNSSYQLTVQQAMNVNDVIGKDCYVP